MIVLFLLHPEKSVSATDVRPEIFLFIIAIPSSAVALLRIRGYSASSGIKALLYLANICIIVLSLFTFILLLPGDWQN